MKKSVLFFLIALFSVFISKTYGQTGPIIDVWYGDTQEFGNNGVPQAWCNIMGNISDSDGVSSSTFEYTLNVGTPVSLSIGGDGRRLVNSGDFNVDITVSDLVSGPNTVEITAEDNVGNQATKTVTINYTDGNIWPIPYNVDWTSLNNDITKVNEVPSPTPQCGLLRIA